MPSTTEITTSGARISQGWFSSEAANWRAVPWKEPWIEVGMPIRAMVDCTASVARESDTLSARLKEMVAATNWLWWLPASGARVVSQRDKVESGTSTVGGE